MCLGDASDSRWPINEQKHFCGINHDLAVFCLLKLNHDHDVFRSNLRPLRPHEFCLSNWAALDKKHRPKRHRLLITI
jgi:hypothetical protein